MTKLEKETLEKAIIVLQENEWTKEFSARNKSGYEVPADSPQACSFCAYGAILKASPDVVVSVSLLNNLCKFIDDTVTIPTAQFWVTPLFAFNDAAESKEEVIQLFRDFLMYEENS